MNCRYCAYPQRYAYGIQGNPVRTLPVIKGNAWGESLTACPECGQLWFTIPYEPWGGYPHSVAWRWTADLWKQCDDPPQGERHTPIYRWHEAELFRYFDSLSADDQELIKADEGFLQGSIHRKSASHAFEALAENPSEQDVPPNA